MPGFRNEINNNYVTAVEEYRKGITVADAEPPVFATATLLQYPVGIDAAATLPKDRQCRIGYDNRLLLGMTLHGVGMTVLPVLYRFVNEVAYDCTPTTWGVVAHSTILYANQLVAGTYTIVLTGNFNGGTADMWVQHTE